MEKFYDRISEIKELEEVCFGPGKSSRMVVLTGRRRVGKTAVAREFAAQKKHLYFFIAKKSESVLCVEFTEYIKLEFPDFPVIGEIIHFKDIFNLLLQISKKEKFTVIIDEFQEFYYINPSIYSEIQKIWDMSKNETRLNVIFIGSVYSLMVKIFCNSREPLFNRADRIMNIRPFEVNVIDEILADYHVKKKEITFHYYLFTGGSPRYIDILTGNRVFTLERIIEYIVSSNSPFIDEGKNLLIEEFGKEYGIYFTILELISSGKTARSEIESILETDIGGYLDRLEKDYGIITRKRPINAKANSRRQKYCIIDNFLNFYFRFIHKNRSAIEIGNYEYIRQIIRRDYTTYAGVILERYHRDILAQSGKYNDIGTYWEGGNQNEIDIVAVNDMEKKILIADVKYDPKRLNIEVLKKKSEKLLKDYIGYDVEYTGFSLVK